MTETKRNSQLHSPLVLLSEVLLKNTKNLIRYFQANNLKDIPTNVLDQVRDKLGYIRESMSFATEYVTKLSIIDWVVSETARLYLTCSLPPGFPPRPF